MEVCPWENFSPTCQRDEVILIQRAFYGRMEVARCGIASELGHGCSGDALALMDEACSGRLQCQIQVPNSKLEDIETTTCKRDLSKYLEVSYECFKGKT